MAEKLTSMHAITLRKMSVKEKQQICKNKMAASKSFCGAAPAMTPSKRPKLCPDWVLRKDKLKEINDPLSALVFVMNCLQVIPKVKY